MGRLEGKGRLDKPRRGRKNKLSVRSLKMNAQNAFRCVRFSAVSTTTPQSLCISMFDFGAVLIYSKIYIFGTLKLNGTKTDFYFCGVCWSEASYGLLRMSSFCMCEQQTCECSGAPKRRWFFNAKVFLKLPGHTQCKTEVVIYMYKTSCAICF